MPPRTHPRKRLPRPQLLVLVAGLTLWAWWPVPAFWALLLAYGAAWALLDRMAGSIPRGERGGTIGVLTLLAVLLVAVAPLASLYRAREALAEGEDLVGLGSHLRDRLRLESTPSVAPPVVFSDHPQRFYLYAPGARTAALSLGTDLEPLAGVPLGHGLFRVAFDPRSDAVPTTERATLEAAVIADGHSHARSLAWVRPLAHPRWFASAPERGQAATTSEETDEVLVVDRQGHLRRLPVADGPTDVAFLDQGRTLVVAHRYTPELWLLDTDTGAVEKRIESARFQVRLAASPSGSRVAVAIDGLAPRIEIHARFGGVETFDLTSAPDWLAFGPRDDLLVVASRADRSLHRFERRTAGMHSAWQETGVLALGRPAVSLARSPGGETLLVAVTDYRPDGQAHRGNHFIEDQLLGVDPVAWRIVDRRLTQRRTPAQDEPGNIDSGVSPMGLALRANGTALIAFAGSEEIWYLPAGAGSPTRVVDGLDLDLIAPTGVGDLGQGFWTASSPAGGALAVYGPASEMIAFLGVTPTDDALAEGAPGSLDELALTLRAGERDFYETTRAGISCQSCHLHAGSDHSRHEIGQKPLLPTLTTLGTAGTGPYLRDGSFPRIRDLDRHLAVDLYRGYLRFEQGRGEALETYVASLPRAVNPRDFEPIGLARERAGFDAFVRARCDLCHVPPAFTNLSQHPVRALFPDYGARLAPGSRIDTPSLLGVFARDRFLQDGRAESLKAVLAVHNRANRHGDSASLSARERAALIDFLLSL